MQHLPAHTHTQHPFLRNNLAKQQLNYFQNALSWTLEVAHALENTSKPSYWKNRRKKESDFRNADRAASGFEY